MPKPRSSLVSLDATPYYHCISRCVRRAFLCGKDHHSGQDYEHRREWVEQRLLQLATIFSIDICAYAVMSNHVHVVLRINAAQALAWSDTEVTERWCRLYHGHPLAQRFLHGSLDQAGLIKVREIVATYRQRLADLSWFMRCLNEDIARRANAEDGCTGRFWEGRFKSQALLDEKALLSCLAYVDLNPIRAGMAETPEQSEYTSIKTRIAAIQNIEPDSAPQPLHLMPFIGHEHLNKPDGLPFRLMDYLELVDWTGRCIRDDKRGEISDQLPPILQRMQIDAKQWQQLSREFEHSFKHFAGGADQLQAACKQLGYQRSPGMANCKLLLN